MANFATTKLFLDQTGLIALVKCIKDVRDGIIEDTTELRRLLDMVAQFDTDDVLIAGILKDTKDIADKLLKWVSNGEEYDGETITVRLDDLTKRIEAYENQQLVADITADEKPDESNNLNFTVTYKDNTTKNFAINCAKFVVDGFLDKVYLVYVDNATIYDAATGEEITAIDKNTIPSGISSKDRFIVFMFKTKNSDGEEYETDTKSVWVAMEDLHESYTFKGDDGYLTIDNARHAGDSNENVVSYGLTEDVKYAVDNFKALESDVAALTERVTALEGEVAAISDYLTNSAILGDDVVSVFKYLVLGEGTAPDPWDGAPYVE